MLILRWSSPVGACIGILIFSLPALAVDGVALEFGTGDEDSVRGGLAMQWEWDRELFGAGNWFLGGFLEFSASYWDADEGPADNNSLAEIGVTPVLRFQPRTPMGGMSPYLEGAIGVHLFTETEFGDRDFDIPFSFGDHLGAGVRFGPEGEFDLGYRYQHLSNLSIGDCNPGINFHLVRLAYHF